jgi:uncharacterized repeat protein (TIGR01451 family)
VGDATTVSVSATNSTTSDATLAGWIDLNGNGTFDAGELVTRTVPAGSGAASYDLVFPAGSVTTDTFARFRLFPGDVTSFSPTGPASAGEVEDYPVTVEARELKIAKTSNATVDSRPGDTITYTVTGTNTGTSDYTAAKPARVWDDLSGVLDDATYDINSATSDRTPPDPVYASPILSWTGALPAGESVTLTYTVKLKGGGDGVVRNVAFGQCDPADPDCDTTTPECDPPNADGTDPDTGKPCAEEEFQLPKLTITKQADRTDLPAVGQSVQYTVTVKNEGPGDYTVAKPGTATDDLTAVLDDTSAPANITADIGTATFSSPTLTWTGVLTAGQSATITYEVTYTGGGDQVLSNEACVPVTEAQDPLNPCATVDVPGSGLDHEKIAHPASGSTVEVGDEVTYTLRFANTGQTTATVDTFDDLSQVLDDADFLPASLHAANGLTATYDAGAQRVNITGSVPVNQILEVTYKVRVKAFAGQGDHVLRNALQCEPGDPKPCDPETTEHLVRALDIEKTSNRTVDTEIGDTVTYTVQAKNIGQADYTAGEPARVWDDLTAVLDDALYNNDAETVPAGVGTVTYTTPTIQWTGALAKGDTITFTYTVLLTGGGNLDVRNVAFGQCDPADPDCDTVTPKCDPPTADGTDPDTGKPCDVVDFKLPRIVDSKSVSPADGTAVKAGDELTYTLRFENTGTAAGNVSKDDSLGMLLDDAELQTPTGITVSDPALTATRNGDLIEVRGRLGAGDVVTVTYTVKVKSDADREAAHADEMLGNFLIEHGTTPPTVCPDPQVDDEDETCNPVSHIVDSKSVNPADGSVVAAGDTVTYTLTFENVGKGVGQVGKDDDLTQVLDDATFESGPTVSGASSVTATRHGARIEVRGTLAAGATATVTYTVKVKPDGVRANEGDDVLANALLKPTDPPPTPPVGCDKATGDEDTTCNPISRIIDSKSVNPAQGTAVKAGDELAYTLRFENLGKGAGTVTKDDYLGMLVDDASIISGPTVSTGAQLTADLNAVGDRIEVRGPLVAGEAVTVTYTVKVKTDGQRAADGGDNQLGNFLIKPGTTPPTGCPDPQVDDEDETCNPVRELSIEKTSDRKPDSTFGDTITYTVTATNTGKADYTAPDPALARDTLAGVLDDATYQGDAHADQPGTLSYNAPVIRWEGVLAVGDKVTITYTVKLKAGGDLNVRNVAWGGPDPAPKCDPRSVDGHDPVTGQPCDTVEFGFPDVVDSKSVNPKSGTPVTAGQTLNYTLTFTNRGTAPGKVNKVDDLSGVLDDATLVAPPVASTNDLHVSAVAGGKFTVTGTLKAGQTVTVTYGMQVKQQQAMGDKSLGNYLLKPGQKPPTECVTDEDTTCNPVSDIAMAKTVDPKDGSKVEAGDRLTYTLTFTNTGKGAGRVDDVDDLTGVFDDATWVSGPRVSDPALTVVKRGAKLRITGTLAGGQAVTVAYTVKVKSEGAQGDHQLLNFLAAPGVENSKCVSGDPLCTKNPIMTPEVSSGNFLPNTGGPAFAALVGGLILLLGGGLLLTASRRRRLRTTGEGSWSAEEDIS